MIKKLVSFLSFLLFLLLCANTTITWAAGYYNDIRVYQNPGKIVYNHEEILQQENTFIYNDRIYVPLRSIAEALSIQVEWKQETQEVNLSPTAEAIYIEVCDPFKGEYFIYGQIISIDYNSKSMYIEQHLDDNSREVFESLLLSDNAIVLLQRKSKQLLIDFDDVKVGDVVSLIVTKDDEIRSIIVDI